MSEPETIKKTGVAYWVDIITHTTLPKNRPDFALLFYRVAISMSFLFIHGSKKVLNFQEEVQHIPDPFHMGGYTATIIAIFSNVVCAIFVALGLFTRLFAIGAFMIPFIGLLIVHANDPWVVKDVPLMYSLAFAIIIVLGPGRYSLDRVISKLWFKEKNRYTR